MTVFEPTERPASKKDYRQLVSLSLDEANIILVACEHALELLPKQAKGRKSIERFYKEAEEKLGVSM